MAGEFEEWMKQFVQAQLALQREQIQAPKTGAAWGVSTLFEKAPAWITLLVAAGTGYALLNTRVSTCEYQNQISIADRADLHHRVDKTDDTLIQVRTDLTEIKVSLKELTARVRR